MQAIAAGQRRLFGTGGLTALWLVTYFAARFALEAFERGTPLAIAAALLPIAPFAAVLWSFIKDIRADDELERRIQLEALAVAFPVTVLLLMVLGLLDLAITLNPDDWSYRHLWPMLTIFWIVGQALARRRYT
jgi:hypothetical protein